MTNDICEIDEKNLAARKVAYAAYILYLVVCIPVLPVLGIIFSYIFEPDANTMLKSHYQYLIRSFWIALLYFSIAFMLLFVVIGVVLLPLCLIWWFIRNVKGLKALAYNEPISNPKTWLF